MKTEERIVTNKRQQEFYNKKNKNLPTRLWSFFRNGLLNRIKKDIKVEKDIYDLHRKWFGDLSAKKVLDLGCYAGNSLSVYLAQNSEYYLGIDLSEKGIESLNKKIEGIDGANAVTVDFLSEEFKESDFDLIYAYGVLHHFKNVEELISKLQEKIRPGGEIITYDPLQTSLPIKFLRTIYRPFQTDKDWEWPFTKKTYYKFEEAFKIKERRAVLGKTKWVVLLNLMPTSQIKKKKVTEAWHKIDWERSSKSDSHMFGCMHLTMLMQQKH